VQRRSSLRRRAAILLAALWIGWGSAVSIAATPAPAAASETVAQPAPSERPGDDVANVVASFRSEVPQLAAGVILIALGLSVLVLSAALGRSSDMALVYFGIFASLYGLRLVALTHTTVELYGVDLPTLERVDAAITYVLNIPLLLFIERVFGPGWRSSITRVCQAWIVFAAVGLPLALLAQDPFWLMPANNILVIAGVAVMVANFGAWRRSRLPGLGVLGFGIAVVTVFVLNNNLAGLALLPWGEGPEEIGFLVFIGCLGHVVALRQLEAQRRLVAIDQELKTARAIQTAILPRDLPELPGVDLAARYVPMTAVGGDFYDVLKIDGRRLGILVADVSGHGVPAALIASMVKVAISSQADHADDPGRVLRGVNQILCGSLAQQFVTAAYVFIDLEARRLTGATAGHPPVLLWSAGDGRVVELGASGILMGHFPDAKYTPVEHPIADGDRIVLYTDGIIEATNRQGEFFDPERLREFIASHPGGPAEAFSGALLGHLSSWCERGPDTGGFEDDITFVVASITPAIP
jgi:sigma-B regulation protein RsbU (phosphoserine phosphatase)